MRDSDFERLALSLSSFFQGKLVEDRVYHTHSGEDACGKGGSGSETT